MLYDKERELIVYEGDDALKAAVTCRPDVWRVRTDAVVVKAEPATLQKLKAAGLPVPNPLVTYHWPGPFSPFHAQVITSAWLTMTPRGFVLNDMGTGKTHSALWAADWLMKRDPGMKWVIMCPISTMRITWEQTILQVFLGARKVSVVTGSPADRIKKLAVDADFYVINQDGLISGNSDPRGRRVDGLARIIADRTDIKGVILDECSAFKHDGTRRHRLTREIARKPYLWMMTGTPCAGGPLDAYGQAMLMHGPGIESYRHYRDRVMYQISRFRWVPRVGAMEAARQMLQPAVRFTIDDCMDLPPCVTLPWEVEMSAQQKEAYKELKKECVVTFGAAQVTAVNEAVLRSKLLQIACGAVYVREGVSHLLDAEPRLHALHELLNTTDEKIIVFAPFTSVLKLIYNSLATKYSCEIVNGSVSLSARTKIFREFQDKADPRVLIADPGTMAHGVTLTAASVVVWYAPTDKTETYLQANKRIDRPGQVKCTRVVQLSATAVEREIYRRLEANEQMQGALLTLIRDAK